MSRARPIPDYIRLVHSAPPLDPMAQLARHQASQRAALPPHGETARKIGAALRGGESLGRAFGVGIVFLAIFLLAGIA